MFSAPILLISKAWHDTEFVVATDASKVGIAGVLLQEDSSGYLRPCVFWARKSKDCEMRYSAYDREALAVVEAMSRVWRLYLLGCIFSQSFVIMQPLSLYRNDRVINLPIGKLNGLND
jgi:hypothetical protein